MLWKNAVGVAVAMIGWGACAAASEETPAEQAPVEQEQQVTVDAQGVMHFASPEIFFATIGEVAKKSTAALDAWEDAHGFVSYRREVAAAMRQLDLAATEEISGEILRRNSDILNATKDRVDARIRAFGYQALTTRDGLFYVGDTLHKVTPDFVVSSQDGRLDTVQGVAAVMALTPLAALPPMNTPAPGVRVARYDVQGLESVTAGCEGHVTAWHNTSDRKVDVELNVTRYYCALGCCNYTYQAIVTGTMRGYRKKTLGKGWTQDGYNTSYSFDSLEFEVTAPRVTGDFIEGGKRTTVHVDDPFTVSPGYGESGSDWQTWQMGSWFIGDQIQNEWMTDALYFNRVKVRGWSRGTGSSGTANICCGYSGGCGF